MQVTDKSFSSAPDANRNWHLKVEFTESLGTESAPTALGLLVARQLEHSISRLADRPGYRYKLEAHMLTVFFDRELADDVWQALTDEVIHDYEIKAKIEQDFKGVGVYIFRSSTCFTRFDLRRLCALSQVINAGSYEPNIHLGHAIWVLATIGVSATIIREKVESVMS